MTDELQDVDELFLNNVSVQILVKSEMSASQLTTYYKCKSITISDVYVEKL
jgi:hypothetical protein